MDSDQALALVGYMAGNFPGLKTTPQQAAVWVDALRPVPEAEAGHVITLLLARERGPRDFPTVGEFMAAWNGHRKRPSEQPALPVPSTSDEQRQSAIANLARLREQVRRAGTAAPNVRLTAEGEARAAATRTPESRPPPEPCYLDDHRYCGTGPVLKRPADPAVTPSTNPIKETP